MYYDISSYIYTLKGIKRISQLREGDVIRNNKELIRISEIGNIVEVDVIKLVLQNNYNYFLDKNTILLNEKDEEVLLKNIEKNSFVKLSSMNYFNNKENSEVLWDNKTNKGHYPIFVPEKNSEKLCEWLGILSAIGSKKRQTGNISIEFTKRDLNLAEYYQKLTKELFDITPLRTESKDRIFFEFNSTNLVKFLTINTGYKFKFRKIPTFLYQSSIVEILAFIKGLSIKGFLDEKKQNIIYNGNSKVLAEFVTFFLRSIGYYTRIKKHNTQNIFYVFLIAKNKNTPFVLDTINSKLNLSLLKENYLIRTPFNLGDYKISAKNTNRSYINLVKKENRPLINAKPLRSIDESSELFNFYFLPVKDCFKVRRKMMFIKFNKKTELELKNLIIKN